MFFFMPNKHISLKIEFVKLMKTLLKTIIEKPQFIILLEQQIPSLLTMLNQILINLKVEHINKNR